MIPYAFQQILFHLQQRVTDLENELAALRKEMQQIKPVVIENMNYKIHELQIKELSGALQIGLSASGAGEGFDSFIKEMVEKQQSMNMQMGGNEEETDEKTEDTNI